LTEHDTLWRWSFIRFPTDDSSLKLLWLSNLCGIKASLAKLAAPSYSFLLVGSSVGTSWIGAGRRV
jgi:hypothetical protein